MKPENVESLGECLANLKNGEVVAIMKHGDDLGVHAVSWEKLQVLLGDGQFVGALCMADRPGNAYFQRYLELTYFHPSGPDESLLACIFLRWSDLLWSLAIVPAAYVDKDETLRYGEEVLTEAAKVARMRVVRNALPHMAGGGLVVMDASSKLSDDPLLAKGGFIHPNLPTEYILYLENQEDHFIYTNPSAAARQQVEDIERLEAEKQ